MSEARIFSILVNSFGVMKQKSPANFYINLCTLLLGNAAVVYGVVALNWNFFMVVYAYWFGELISTVFDKIKVRTLKSRKELTNIEITNNGRFFFLFIYWVFIVLIVGFVTAPSKIYGENFMVILFLNNFFNLSLLCVFLGELAQYVNAFFIAKNYDPATIISDNNTLNKKTIIMHVSIIFGTLAWFTMNTDKFFSHIDAGKYGNYGFMIVFVIIRLTGDLIGLRADYKKYQQEIYP